MAKKIGVILSGCGVLDGSEIHEAVLTLLAAALQAMGARHVECPVKEAVVDRQRKLITSPAYMLAQRISETADGIDKTVATLVEMA